jgi:hypothetical protein
LTSTGHLVHSCVTVTVVGDVKSPVPGQ